MRIAVAMSGGIDSTVAAHLLKKQGHSLVGVYMRNWDPIEEGGVCFGESEVLRCRHACDKLDIPFFAVDFVKEYWNDVFSRFIESYQDGLTPNPDVLCNRAIKFGAFFEYALASHRVDAVATGHYARISNNPPYGRLLRAADFAKDQTYFLAGLPSEVLSRVVFPVGGLLKSEVKRIGIEAGFADVAKQKESMGICFVGKRDLGDFLGQYIDSSCVPDGPKVLLGNDGELVPVGKHCGLHLHTLGQRAAVGGWKERCFVAGKDLDSNTLYVVPGHEHPTLHCTEIAINDLHWTARTPPVSISASGMQCWAQIRHQQQPFECIVTSVSSSAAKLSPRPTLRRIGFVPEILSGGTWAFPTVSRVSSLDDGVSDLYSDEILLQSRKAIRSPTPGQAVAIYDENNRECLAGGTIATTFPHYSKSLIE